MSSCGRRDVEGSPSDSFTSSGGPGDGVGGQPALPRSSGGSPDLDLGRRQLEGNPLETRLGLVEHSDVAPQVLVALVHFADPGWHGGPFDGYVALAPSDLRNPAITSEFDDQVAAQKQ